MNDIIMTVDTEYPVTLQSFLMMKKGVSRRMLNSLKHTESGLTRNGAPVRSIDTVNPGDTIVLSPRDENRLEPNFSLSVPVVFENGSVIVFDKPCGMPVHPSANHHDDTLGNYFAVLCPDITFRPLNRLDKDTTGLCAVAKNELSAKILQKSIEKTYFAAVHGIIDESGTVDAPIGRADGSIILRCVRDDGRPSVTHYTRLTRNAGYSLAKVLPETGRTHQIRVHFSYIGHPLAGDDLYGGSRADIGRQALHCGKISFTDPQSGDVITVNSDIPEDIRGLFD